MAAMLPFGLITILLIILQDFMNFRLTGYHAKLYSWSLKIPNVWNGSIYKLYEKYFPSI